MKAIDLYNHMKEIGPWVNWNNTTDYVHAGNPETEVKGIAVAWQGRLSALREAVKLGCNLLVTHEQIDYPERQVQGPDSDKKQQYALDKEQFIKENNLVIIRCHDTWDRVPEIGIVHAWGAHLGFGKRLAGEPNATEAMYASPKPTLIELAKYVLEKTKALGQDSVEMIGDPNAKVSKVAVGCGAGTEYGPMTALGADVLIVTDDGIRYWADGAWALDSGTPMIAVNHCVSEEPGMKTLAEYIRKQFPDVKNVHHIMQGSLYKTVG